MKPLLLCGTVILLISGCAQIETQSTSSENFVGAVTENPTAAASEAIAVRNDIAQPADEIVTLRYFKIKKGAFPEFYRLSQEGVWPYFEKIGARVIGMWKVVAPIGADVKEHPDYDEVYLSTRYASYEHWAATREMAKLGGNGPDWKKCVDALAGRRALTLESHVIFLKGGMAPGGPYFMPSVH